mmetsp:Transcript_112430/g.350386  ORF Transcript_112430/g.350386 Transcript_112430/m.350386 type:complete len:233 (-) Transcript_112430:218-916(-)
MPHDVSPPQSLGEAMCPPSSTILAPVVQEPAREARNKQAPVMSPGAPMRPPISLRPKVPVPPAALIVARIILDWKAPGKTQFTATCSWTRRPAKTSDMWTTAALPAEYAKVSRKGVCTASMLATLMTLAGSSADAEAFSSGRAHLVRLKTAVTLRSFVLFQPATSNSSSGCAQFAPALFTRQWSLPEPLRTASTTLSTSPCCVRSAEMAVQDPGPLAVSCLANPDVSFLEQM